MAPPPKQCFLSTKFNCKRRLALIFTPMLCVHRHRPIFPNVVVMWVLAKNVYQTQANEYPKRAKTELVPCI